MKRLHAPSNGWLLLVSLAALAIGALSTFAAHAQGDGGGIGRVAAASVKAD